VRFSGSHVLVTVPVGVLKKGSISFDPPLSQAKQKALSRLDMGNLEKVVLVWDQVWWSGSIEYVDGLDQGIFPEFYDLSALTGVPTLVGLYGGRYSRQLQGTASDEEIVASALAVLEKVHGRTLPAPTTSAVTHWTTDPYSLGSYLYLPVGASPDDIETIAEPQGDRLLFAGEGTEPDYYGNVHAAVLSAFRECTRMGVRKFPVEGWEEW
jgi:monoamine oxidase